jgi:hypothetical protein
VPASDRSDDLVGTGGPSERFGLDVVYSKNRLMAAWRSTRDRRTVLQSPLSEDGEEALDSVEPSTRDRVEVERPARMRRKPFADFRMLVGGVIVDDRMHDFSGGDLRLDGIEKADELLMPMTLHVAADHRPVQDVQRGKERRRCMSDVIAGRHQRSRWRRLDTGPALAGCC